jgi:spermidine/putrescine transport system substrate-binding protein
MALRRRPPADPMTRGLISAARSSALTRRSLFGTAALGGAAAALSACAPPPPPSGGVSSLVLPEDLSDTDKVVRWANWTAYLDYDEETKKYPTLERFMAETGIRAEYTEDIEDNDAYFNKIAPQLRAGQDIGRDIFTFTDWMANRIIRDQLCQPLELITMPNAPNLLPALQNVSFDPGRNFSLTWQTGFAGIGYDKSKVSKEIKTIDDLWTDELKGKIVVLSEFRDTVGHHHAEPGRRHHLRLRQGAVRGCGGRDREAHGRGLHPPDQGQLLPRGPQVGQRHRRHRLER